jgi:hypothetical protein
LVQATGRQVDYVVDGKASGTYDVVVAVVSEDVYRETAGDRTGDIVLRDVDAAMLTVYCYCL